jgi:hypothetical protein
LDASGELDTDVDVDGMAEAVLSLLTSVSCVLRRFAFARPLTSAQPQPWCLIRKSRGHSNVTFAMVGSRCVTMVTSQ